MSLSIEIREIRAELYPDNSFVDQEPGYTCHQNHTAHHKLPWKKLTTITFVFFLWQNIDQLELFHCNCWLWFLCLFFWKNKQTNKQTIFNFISSSFLVIQRSWKLQDRPLAISEFLPGKEDSVAFFNFLHHYITASLEILETGFHKISNLIPCNKNEPQMAFAVIFSNIIARSFELHALSLCFPWVHQVEFFQLRIRYHNLTKYLSMLWFYYGPVYVLHGIILYYGLFMIVM